MLSGRTKRSAIAARVSSAGYNRNSCLDSEGALHVTLAKLVLYDAAHLLAPNSLCGLSLPRCAHYSTHPISRCTNEVGPNAFRPDTGCGQSEIPSLLGKRRPIHTFQRRS